MEDAELPQMETPNPSDQKGIVQSFEQANTLGAKQEDIQAASHMQIHQKTNSGDLIAPQGDHARITVFNYNYYGAMFQDALQHVNHIGDDEKIAQSASEKENLQSNLSFELEGVSRIFSSKSTSQRNTDQLPSDEEALSNWYYTLNEYEQCFIQSVAICNGASAHDLFQEADILYRLVQRQKHMPLVQTDRSTEHDNISQQAISIPRQPRLQLLKRTHTISKRIKGAECLFWQDVDEYGLSHFGHRVLVFLAHELLSKGEHWPDLLKTIHDWSKAQRRYTRQITQALGVIYWSQNTTQLQQKAREWAKEASFSSRRKVTSLLEGAFEVEQLYSMENSNSTPNDNIIVLVLLQEWIKTVHTTLNIANINMGCAIASTFGAIGKREQYTQLALRGFRKLMDIGKTNIGVNIHPLSTSITSNYVSLVWTGHGRIVLAELGEIMQTYTYHYQHPKQLAERNYYYFSRELWLNITVNAFFLIAAALTPEHRTYTRDQYEQPLPQQLDVPDPAKRNIFVWAIISDDELTQHTVTLLCAIITTPRRKAAFELINIWIEVVLALWERDMQKGKPYRRFVDFFVDLGKCLLSWQHDLQQSGYKLPPVFHIYHYQLQIWRQQKQGQYEKKMQLVNDVLSFFQKVENTKEVKS